MKLKRKVDELNLTPHSAYVMRGETTTFEIPSFDVKTSRSAPLLSAVSRRFVLSLDWTTIDQRRYSPTNPHRKFL